MAGDGAGRATEATGGRAVKYGRLLAPGQSVDAVLEAEKSREAAILRAGFWVARWTRGDLGDVKAFRRQTLAIMEVARRRIA